MSATQTTKHKTTTKQKNAFWVTIQTQNRFYIPTRIVEYTGLQTGDKIQLKINKTKRWRPKKCK